MPSWPPGGLASLPRHNTCTISSGGSGVSGNFIGDGVPLSITRQVSPPPADCAGCGAPPEPAGRAACTYCGRANGRPARAGAAFVRFVEAKAPPAPVFPAAPVRGQVCDTAGGPYTWSGNCWLIGAVDIPAVHWMDRLISSVAWVLVCLMVASLALPPEVARAMGSEWWLGGVVGFACLAALGLLFAPGADADRRG